MRDTEGESLDSKDQEKITAAPDGECCAYEELKRAIREYYAHHPLVKKSEKKKAS